MILVLEFKVLARFQVTDEVLYKGLVENYELEELDRIVVEMIQASQFNI